ncbi:hypothetical protein [Roseibium sp. Sym1]|uniref:hypothetical protein n=1 Tax=Roseibium sp. Sym1 TaxID=3016006 RepID=UPI0022B4E972|nr:hypothetical protein [Roseibium sp. Sym1]
MIARWRLIGDMGGHRAYQLNGKKLSAFAYTGGAWAIYGPPKQNGDAHAGGQANSLPEAKSTASKKLKELEAETV